MVEKKEAIEFVSGKGEIPGDFSNMDMNFNLKLGSYVNLCLPSNYQTLEKQFDLPGLRKRGIAPIVYYTAIQNTPQKVSFGHPVYVKNKVRLCRNVMEYPAVNAQEPGKRVERLMFDLSTESSAHQNTGGAEKLGLSEEIGEIRPVGKIHIYQIFTKPLALAHERRVTEVPEELRSLKEHSLPGPFPSIEGLEKFPENFQKEQELSPFFSVWGMSNTDINQHVNMVEYIDGFQEHFTRLLFHAKKPISTHFIHEAQIIFRKPFFPGQRYAIQGKIGFDGEQSVLLAGYYLADDGGNLDPNPFNFTRMNGSFCLE
ncbi:MAG: hypothetical protein HQM13_00085 [SAR324 cluster bacterium]|nr:hypothetical protein [SAR324 cluster bacterium]